ncbi:hypothetical protein ACWZHB_01000 [Nocardia sp. FBN12]|uniref:hypothetical protein n=1 Tax=Nocardia sp. FBN12 TaxID=3419766 RepID=UPI003CFDD027
MVIDMLAKILLARAARRQLLLLNAQDRVHAMFRMTDPADGRSVNEFAGAAAEVSAAAQRRAVSLTLAAQRRYLDEMGTDIKDFVTEVPDEVRMFARDREYRYATARKVKAAGVVTDRLPVEEVFNRPARMYRRLLAEGRDPGDALDVAANRVKMELATNISLAEREAESQVLAHAGIVDLDVIGWRRVVRPELSVGGTCGLCLAASDRKYHTGDLKPIHAGCKCEVMPIKADADPGRRLNDEDLGKLYDDAGGTAGRLLKRTRYRVDEHGELQAVLVPDRRGEAVPRYRDPSSTPLVDLDQSTEAFAARQLPLMRQMLTKSRSEGLGEDHPKVVWQTAQVARYERLLSVN